MGPVRDNNRGPLWGPLSRLGCGPGPLSRGPLRTLQTPEVRYEHVLRHPRLPRTITLEV